jgi:hypothetical protein
LAPYKEARVAFTARGRAVYAIYLPEEGQETLPGQITLTAVRPAPGSDVRLLGVTEPLPWRAEGGGVRIDVPDAVRRAPPCRHAFVLKLSV